MELKKYKKQMNMPKYALGDPQPVEPEKDLHGFQANKGDWGGAITGAISFGGSIANAYEGVKSTSDIITESGTSVGSGTGFTYNKLNNVDFAAQRSELSAQNTNNTLKAAGTGAQLGGSIGMAFGPVGSAIGAAAGGIIGGVVGIFGGKSRKRRLERKMRLAQERIFNTNNYNLASAQSDYLQNQFELENGNTQDGELFVANRGKDMLRPKRIKK